MTITLKDGNRIAIKGLVFTSNESVMIFLANGVGAETFKTSEIFKVED